MLDTLKHVFVINPKAGKYDHSPEIREKLKSYDGKIDYEIYVTQYKADAQRFVKEYLNNHPSTEKIRFYACGGDGTLYDVVNGAIGHENAEVDCFASGSGNDFAKNFHDLARFCDLDKAIRGQTKRIDILKIGDKYCANITNAGFDGKVTYNMLKYKNLPFVSGPTAYRISAFTTILGRIHQYMKVSFDGEEVFKGETLLIAIGNGYCYGGGFLCCPEAKIDDGLIDVCLIKRVRKTKVANFMKLFRSGEHVSSPKVSDVVIYRKCHKVEFWSDEQVPYAIDGEVFLTDHLTAEILPSALPLVIPSED
ncbi:MAG: diacylglycerol kinase family lipid kinase [Bacilli bacterium]|jgi:YegS/Rv2252/BmrU family lipid kinase|nr:diacylglycerol kinase family lipid kinase [Bacilli bacterium]